jgi:hypothetical protein
VFFGAVGLGKKQAKFLTPKAFFQGTCQNSSYLSSIVVVDNLGKPFGT